MVEINITEKRRSWIPWALGAMVLAALIWFVSAQNSPDRNQTARTNAYDTNSAAGMLDASRDSAAFHMDSMRMQSPR